MTLAAAAAGAAGAGAPTALAAPADDQTILRLNLQVEQVVALAYELALSSGRLDRRHRATATDILAHERAHEQALATYLRERWGMTAWRGLELIHAAEIADVDDRLYGYVH